MSFAITDLLLNTGGVQKPCYRSIVSNTDTFENREEVTEIGC